MKFAVLLTLVGLFGACLAEDATLFVPAGVFSADFGGAAGADTICRSAAGNSFVSLISSATAVGSAVTGPNTNTEVVQAINRVASQFSYVNLDGDFIGNSSDIFNSALSLQLLAPILDTDRNVPDKLTRAFTGSNPDGTYDTGRDCTSWTVGVNIPGLQGDWGVPISNGSTWFFSGSEVCSSTSTLYCVEQLLVVCVFVTEGAYPSGNATAFDAICDDESKKFESKAIFETGERTILSSFPGAEGSYLLINTRGEFLNSLRGDLVFGAGSIDGNFILTVGQNVINGLAWTGLNGFNCGGDFSSTSESELSTVGNATLLDSNGLFQYSTVNCSGEYYLYCAQQDQIGTASAHGDPHFKGFDGSKYNFMGADGEIFAIISDVGFAVNAEFRRMKVYDRDGTWMTKVGIRVHDETLVYDPRFGLLVNGEIVTATIKTKEFDIIIAHDGFEVVCASVGYGVSVASISFRTEFGLLEHFLDLQVSLLATPVKPHGVLGQTATFLVEDKDPQPLNTNDDNGKGVVQGIWTDYLVHDGITGIDFNFSTFSGSEAARRVPAKEARSLKNTVGSFVAFSPLI